MSLFAITIVFPRRRPAENDQEWCSFLCNKLHFACRQNKILYTCFSYGLTPSLLNSTYVVWSNNYWIVSLWWLHLSSIPRYSSLVIWCSKSSNYATTESIFRSPVFWTLNHDIKSPPLQYQLEFNYLWWTSNGIVGHSKIFLEGPGTILLYLVKHTLCSNPSYVMSKTVTDLLRLILNFHPYC